MIKYIHILYQIYPSQGGGILLSYIPPVPQFPTDQVNHCEKKDVEMETDENEPLGEEKCLGSPSISGSVSYFQIIDVKKYIEKYMNKTNVKPKHKGARAAKTNHLKCKYECENIKGVFFF